jgi:hypothetical protein
VTDYILIAAKYKLTNVLATRIKATLEKRIAVIIYDVTYLVISSVYHFNGTQSF